MGIAIAGFLGAVSRYGIGLLIPHPANAAAFPWGTLFINVSGSWLLGLLTGWLAVRKNAPSWFGDMAGTGFLGSYTTFSAFNGQLWQLLEQQVYGSAILYAMLSAAGGWWLAAAGLSWASGRSKAA